MNVVLRRACFLFLLSTAALNIQAQENKLSVSYDKDSVCEKIIATAYSDIQAGRYDIAIMALEGLIDLQHLPIFKKDLLPSVYLNLGGAYLFKGDYESCITHLHGQNFMPSNDQASIA